MKRTCVASAIAVIAATIGSVVLAASLPTAPVDEADDLSFSPALPQASLPTPLVFGDPSQFCLPGNPTCTTAPVPPDAGPPSGTLLAQVRVGNCVLDVRLGNVVLRGWANLGGRFRPVQLALRDFAVNVLQPFAGDRLYFSVVTEVVAQPVDATACRTVRQADIAFDLGSIRWSGSAGAVGYGGAGRIASLSVVAPAPDPGTFTLTWIGQVVHVHGGGAACGPALFESGIYEVRSTAPVVLFPTVKSVAIGALATPVNTTRCLPVRG